MSRKRIAVIAGDGIGQEVMPEGVRVMEAAASKFGIDLQFDHFDFSSWDYYEKHGKMLPDDWKDRIGGHDAILVRPMAYVTLTIDHRVVDGHQTNAWLTRFVEVLESWPSS